MKGTLTELTYWCVTATESDRWEEAAVDENKPQKFWGLVVLVAQNVWVQRNGNNLDQNWTFLSIISLFNYLTKPTNQPTNQLRGPKSFLRYHRSLRKSTYSPHRKEPEGSLPRSQQPATCAYSEPVQSRSRPLILFSFLCSISILPYLPRLGLPNSHVPSHFPTKYQYALLFTFTRVTRPSQCIP